MSGIINDIKFDPIGMVAPVSKPNVVEVSPEQVIAKNSRIEGSVMITTPEHKEKSVQEIIASKVAIPSNLDEMTYSFKGGVVSELESVLHI